MRDHRQLGEGLTALDGGRRIGRRCPGEHAAWIERLANECREPLAWSGRTGQDDQQPRVGLGQDTLAAPRGDSLELLLRIGGAQDFGCGGWGTRPPGLRRGARLARPPDRAPARREAIEAAPEQRAAPPRPPHPPPERAPPRPPPRAAAPGQP